MPPLTGFLDFPVSVSTKMPLLTELEKPRHELNEFLQIEFASIREIRVKKSAFNPWLKNHRPQRVQRAPPLPKPFAPPLCCGVEPVARQHSAAGRTLHLKMSRAATN
jgi:hypothetical protein